VVDRLAHARDELCGALADPRAEHWIVGLLAVQPPDLAASLGLGHDEDALALAEAGRRRPLCEPRNPLHRLPFDAALFEPAHGPTLHDELGELHDDSSFDRRTTSR